MSLSDKPAAVANDKWERHARARTSALVEIGGANFDDAASRETIKAIALQVLNAGRSLSALISELIACPDTNVIGDRVKAAGSWLDRDMPVSDRAALSMLYAVARIALASQGRDPTVKWGVTFEDVLIESNAIPAPASAETLAAGLAVFSATVPEGYPTLPPAEVLDQPATDAASGFMATMMMEMTGVPLTADQFVLVRTVAHYVTEASRPLSEFVEMLSWEPELDQLVSRLRERTQPQTGAVTAAYFGRFPRNTSRGRRLNAESGLPVRVPR
jgi:hypothetical protein